MERAGGLGEKSGVGEFVEVGGTGEDARSFAFPPLIVAAFDEFGFDQLESLQEELKGIGESEGVLAGDAASELMDEEFAKGDIDGRRGLEVADRGEDIVGSVRCV